jgi:putative flippase GtrA
MNGPAGRGLAAEVGRFLRGNFSSAVASGLDYVLVTVLVLVGLHYLLAATAGALAGAATDFGLKRYWAFDRPARGAIHHEGLRYLAVSGASLVLNLIVAYGLVDGLHLPEIPGVIAASLVVGIAWNYPMHRCFVFRAPLPAAPAEEAVASSGGRP